MNPFEIMYIIGGVLAFGAKALLLISSAVYFFKTGGIGGLLMFIGSMLSVITAISKPFITAAVGARMGPEDVVWAQGWISMAEGAFLLVFAIGFVISIFKRVKELGKRTSPKKSG